MTDAYVTPSQIQSVWRAKEFTTIPTASLGEKVIQQYIGYTGDGYVAGEAASGGSQDGRFKLNGVPGIGRVMIFERGGNGHPVYVTETQTASDGTWRIDYLARDKIYFVLGVDQSGTFSLGGQDWVTPVAM